MPPPVWLPLLVLALPFANFVLLAVVAPLRRAGRAAGAVGIAAVAAALAGALVGPFAVTLELLGLLLVAALLGAIYFARTEE